MQKILVVTVLSALVINNSAVLPRECVCEYCMMLSINSDNQLIFSMKTHSVCLRQKLDIEILLNCLLQLVKESFIVRFATLSRRNLTKTIFFYLISFIYKAFDPPIVHQFPHSLVCLDLKRFMLGLHPFILLFTHKNSNFRCNFADESVLQPQDISLSVTTEDEKENRLSLSDSI